VGDSLRRGELIRKKKGEMNKPVVGKGPMGRVKKQAGGRQGAPPAIV